MKKPDAPTDYTRRFLFEDYDVRGELVQLEQSYGELLHTHHYPPPVARLLGEFLSAAVLLSTSIKFRGRLSLQARSDGPVSLLVVECTSTQGVRGLAQFGAAACLEPGLPALLTEGTLAITIEPDGGQRYQGIVPLEGGDLSASLQHYFFQSEQVQTRFVLATDGTRCAGLMLQQLPAQRVPDSERRAALWEELTVLAQTLQADELLQLEAEAILRRLFHQELLRLFDPKPVHFRCHCSRMRTANALRLLGRDEVEDLLQQRPDVEMTCEFCNQVYRFDRAAVEALFRGGHASDDSAPPARH